MMALSYVANRWLVERVTFWKLYLDTKSKKLLENENDSILGINGPLNYEPNLA
jgi:hypothetical protein